MRTDRFEAKTFYIDPHGCAKNQVDAEAMSAALERAGYRCLANPEDAAAIIVNSCGFIESAKRESLEALIDLKSMYPDKKLILAGCLAQRYPEELSLELREADGFFGNSDLSRAPEALGSALEGGRPVLIPRDSVIEQGERTKFFGFPGSAYLKITEGCSNLCSYCAIPIIRGKLASRSADSIVGEAEKLLEKGFFELNLVGQDLGSYGKDRSGSSELSGLLRRLSRLAGKFWIRCLYLHPDHFPEDILEVCASDPRILPYFDIPFQHASEPILLGMNRKGGTKSYLDLLERIRSRLTDAAIRSTFLVGFPGETEEDFRLLLDFQERAALDWLGVFEYSREEGTKAYSMKGRVPKKSAAERKRRIEENQIPITEKRLARFVGRTLDVLIEERVEGEGLALGRAFLSAPEVDGLVILSDSGESKPGEVLPCLIVKANGFDLEGVPLKEMSSILR